jgi:hypothetical protein
MPKISTRSINHELSGPKVLLLISLPLSLPVHTTNIIPENTEGGALVLDRDGGPYIASSKYISPERAKHIAIPIPRAHLLRLICHYLTGRLADSSQENIFIVSINSQSSAHVVDIPSPLKSAFSIITVLKFRVRSIIALHSKGSIPSKRRG